MYCTIVYTLQSTQVYSNRTVCCSCARRRDDVLRMWAQLLDKLDARRKKLDHSAQLQRVFGEMFYLRDWIEEIKVLELPTALCPIF